MVNLTIPSKTAMVHYYEPGPNGENLHKVISVEEAIMRATASAKKSKRWGTVEYNNQDALMDFISVHWAWLE